MSNHRFVHVELSSRDRAESSKFYGEVFGWTFQEFPEMSYTTFDAAGGLGGGFNPTSENMPAGIVTPYIHTDDIHDTVAKVTAAGGEILMPPMSIPGVGELAVFKDLTGNWIGLLQPAS